MRRWRETIDRPLSIAGDRGGALRVLAVEDDDSSFALLESLLADVDAAELVGRARNGAEALELVAELDPDVVLMDLHMPVMDGIEATRRLREVGARAKVVVVTSSDEPGEVEAALAAGAASKLDKPPSREALVEAISPR